jgi:hypothetical protein
LTLFVCAQPITVRLDLSYEYLYDIEWESDVEKLDLIRLIQKCVEKLINFLHVKIRDELSILKVNNSA